jgi:hypothetical protein
MNPPRRHPQRVLCPRNTPGVARALRAAAAALLLTLAGCAAPAIVVSAGLGVAQIGSAVYNNGKLSAAWKRPLPEVRDAAERALGQLGYGIANSTESPSGAEIIAREQDGRTISVTLERSSPEVTLVRIRIGYLGDQPLSRLILEEIAESSARPFVAP